MCVCLCAYSRVGTSCVGRPTCVCAVWAPLRRVNTKRPATRWVRPRRSRRTCDQRCGGRVSPKTSGPTRSTRVKTFSPVSCFPPEVFFSHAARGSGCRSHAGVLGRSFFAAARPRAVATSAAAARVPAAAASSEPLRTRHRSSGRGRLSRHRSACSGGWESAAPAAGSGGAAGRRQHYRHAGHDDPVGQGHGRPHGAAAEGRRARRTGLEPQASRDLSQVLYTHG